MPLSPSRGQSGNARPVRPLQSKLPDKRPTNARVPRFLPEGEGLIKKHKTFLRQYGDCFPEVATCLSPDKLNGGCPLDWFPKILVFTYYDSGFTLTPLNDELFDYHAGENDWDYAVRDPVRIDGKLNKHRILTAFSLRYFGNEQIKARLPSIVLELFESRNRSFDMNNQFRLACFEDGDDYGAWVSHHSHPKASHRTDSGHGGHRRYERSTVQGH